VEWVWHAAHARCGRLSRAWRGCLGPGRFRASSLLAKTPKSCFGTPLAVTTNKLHRLYQPWAFDLAEHKEWKQAEDLLRASLTINPGVDAAWTQLATILIEEDRLDEAISDCELSLRAGSPVRAGAHSTLGLALLRQGQTNAATAHLSGKRSNSGPDFWRGTLQSGQLCSPTRARSSRRSQHYKAALHSDPYSADAHNNLAYVLGAARQTGGSRAGIPDGPSSSCLVLGARDNGLGARPWSGRASSWKPRLNCRWC